MSEFRASGYELNKIWNSVIDQFNSRPNGEYGAQISKSAGTRLSQTDGAPEYTFFEASLVGSGNNTTKVRIDIDFDNLYFVLTHVNSQQERIRSEKLELSSLVEHLIDELKKAGN